MILPTPTRIAVEASAPHYKVPHAQLLQDVLQPLCLLQRHSVSHHLQRVHDLLPQRTVREEGLLRQKEC